MYSEKSKSWLKSANTGHRSPVARWICGGSAVLVIATFFGSATPLHAAAQKEKVLAIPFASEIPDGVWKKPWNNACEEASMIMADQYYRGKTTLSIQRTKELMLPIFPIEDKIFGSNADTNTERTAKIINEYLGFSADVHDLPTIKDITDQLDAGRPVLSFHYAKKLIEENKRLRFRPDGSFFHVMLIVGYNADAKQFIVHDTGDHNGAYFHYSYAAIMDSLHDFNHTTHKANGPARVLFTSPKKLVRATGSHRVYLLANGVKHYITHPRVFANKKWEWKWVQPIAISELDRYTTGNDISQ